MCPISGGNVWTAMGRKPRHRAGENPVHLSTAIPRADPRDQIREAVVESQFSTSWANYTTSVGLIAASRHLLTSSSGIVQTQKLPVMSDVTDSLTLLNS